MPAILLLPLVSGAVLLAGAAIYTIQNSPGGTLRPGTRTPLQPAPAGPLDFEGLAGGSDTIDPLTETGEVYSYDSTSESQIRDLQNAMAAEAETTCEYCAPCGFLAGKVVNASFPFIPAMDYQHRVSTMMGGGAPLLNFYPEMPRIEEWSIAGSRMDGFNSALCFLIEAKMGYGRYLGDSPISVPGPGGEAINILPILEEAVAVGRMAAVSTQMRNHNTLAQGFPLRPGSQYFWHHVFWFCSNIKLKLYCFSFARISFLTRLRVFHMPVSALPPSIWRT